MTAPPEAPPESPRSLLLPRFGVGCWALGGKCWGDDGSDAEALGALAFARDRGLRLFDTAPLYGHGHADQLLQKAFGTGLKDLLIATKVGVRFDPSQGDHAESDLSPGFLREDCEASLRRLQLEQIPLLQVHWPCEQGTALESTLETLLALQQEGKIAHFGLCNYSAQALSQARQLCPSLACLQTPYSMMRREFEATLREVCQGLDNGSGQPPRPSQRPLPVIAYEPLMRGLLSAKFEQPPSFPETDLRAHDPRFRGGAFRRSARLAQGLARIGGHFGCRAAAVAIAWVLRQPAISSVLVGVKRPAQLKENLRALCLIEGTDLSAEDLEPAAGDPAAFPWELIDTMIKAASAKRGPRKRDLVP